MNKLCKLLCPGFFFTGHAQPLGCSTYYSSIEKTSITQEQLVIVRVAFYSEWRRNPFCQRFGVRYPVDSTTIRKSSPLSIVTPFYPLLYPAVSAGYSFLSRDE